MSEKPEPSEGVRGSWEGEATLAPALARRQTCISLEGTTAKFSSSSPRRFKGIRGAGNPKNRLEGTVRNFSRTISSR